ncbi:MAG: nitrous oxide-stimulated promoter family protein [Thermoleophilia bacterium]|nr:nitrous oxide-stimulated promoter family protein [Thermoleophilia bacterium]
MLSESNSSLSRRLRREKKTLEVMIRMYCAANHGAAGAGPDGAGTDALCDQCAELLAYSVQRIDRCRFGNDKPTCAWCSVHCFRTDMRERVREVMRYSGPRMASRHPCLALAHLLDRRRTPEEG